MNNMNFNRCLYDLGDFFTKYHNAKMSGVNYSITELKKDFECLLNSVNEMADAIKDMEM